MIDHPAPGKPPRYAARVFVLAKLAALRQRVLAGHSLRNIYALEGADKVMGYRQFVRYVERYLPAESRIQRWSAQRQQGQPPAIRATSSAEPRPSLPPTATTRRAEAATRKRSPTWHARSKIS